MKLNCNCCDGIYDSLDVRFTKKCDNNCGFCIDKICEFVNQGEAPVRELIKKTIDSGISSVLILGGEPFLNITKLRDYVLGIRKHVKTIYITTSLPKIIIEKLDITKEIIDNIDGLNISFQHYNWKKNNKLMNATSNHNRFDILTMLSDIYSDKIRIAINLVKGGIDSMYKMHLFLSYLSRHKIKKIKINELCNCESLYISYEKIMDIKMDSPFSTGCQTNIDYFDLEIVLKRSCFITEKSLDASIMDLIKILIKKLFKFNNKNRFAVLYEDGSIYNQWRNYEKENNKNCD